jgi:hypothetical protein
MPPYELIDRYAMPLYLQAISLLLPPTTEKVNIEDRCEGTSARFPRLIPPA